jgi:hypothetical protein
VKKVTKNTGGNLTPAALGGQLQINRNDTVSTLQESVAKLHARNQMLARQIRNITKMGGVDKYELIQIRKMVKEDLFKRVKFITTTAMEAKCMKYLSNKLNVPAERQHKWSATYAHCIQGLGFSVHLRGTNIMAHFREVIHTQSFWEVFMPKGSGV